MEVQVLSKITYVVANSEKDALNCNKEYETPEKALSQIKNENQTVYQKTILISEFGIDDP